MNIRSLRDLLNLRIPMLWAVAVVVVLIVVLWGYVSSNLIMKMERTSLDVSPRSFGYNFEPFGTVTSDGVEIDGWFVPSKKTVDTTIVVLHGWGANRSDVIPSTIFLAEHYNMAYFDFRNHGRSGRSRTSLTCGEIKDFTAVVAHLRSARKEQTEKLAVFGFSMGGSVALSGSADMPEIKAVIAESPFSSYNETVIRFAKLFYGIPRVIVPLTLLFTRIRLGFDPEKCSPIYHVSRLSPRPVFLIQAGSDARMPPSEGKALYDAAREPKELWIVPEGNHGDIQDMVPDEYKKKILSFYRKWVSN